MKGNQSTPGQDLGALEQEAKDDSQSLADEKASVEKQIEDLGQPEPPAEEQSDSPA